MRQPDQEERRMFNTLTVFALLIRCPAGDAVDGCTCPFAKYRNGRGLEEKFMIAESIPDETCRELLGFHDNCLAGASHGHKTNPDATKLHKNAASQYQEGNVNRGCVTYFPDGLQCLQVG